MWMGSPSIYVFDCSNAGCIVDYIRKNVPAFRDQQDMVDIQTLVIWKRFVFYMQCSDAENSYYKMYYQAVPKCYCRISECTDCHMLPIIHLCLSISFLNLKLDSTDREEK